MKTLKKIMALAISALVTGALVLVPKTVAKADPAQSATGTTVGFVTTAYGVDIYGIDENGKKIQTTFSNLGYQTVIQVGDGKRYNLGNRYFDRDTPLGTFENGKVYTVDGIEVSVTVSLNGTGDCAIINYVVKNTTSSAKTVKLGTFADTQIKNKDSSCRLSVENGRVYLKHPTEDIGFAFAANQGGFTTTYVGYFGDCNQHIFENGPTSNSNTDSGIAFSWLLNVPAGATVNKASFSAVGDVNVIDDIIDDATTDDKEAGDWLDPLRTQLHIAADPEFGANVNNTADYTGDFALPAEIMQYIKDNPQVTLNYSFYVDDVLRTVTITGKNVVVEEGVQYYGFNYLLSHYGDGSAVTGPTGIYTIVKGDTLTSIAKKFGTTIEALAAKNGIKNVDLIYAGAKIAY